MQNTPTDQGHESLITDLEVLLDEAEDYEFHDFKNRNYAAPKVTLAEKLHQLRENIINGKYDN